MLYGYKKLMTSPRMRSRMLLRCSLNRKVVSRNMWSFHKKCSNLFVWIKSKYFKHCILYCSNSRAITSKEPHRQTHTQSVLVCLFSHVRAFLFSPPPRPPRNMYYGFGQKCVLKNIAVRSKPHPFMESQELGIDVISMKKVEEKAMRREAAGGWSAPLWAGSVEGQQELRAGGRRDEGDQQALHKGGQETTMAMPAQRSAWGAGARLDTGLCLQWIAVAVYCKACLPSRRRVSLAEGHGNWSLSLMQMRFRETSFIHWSISSFPSWQLRREIFFFWTCELNIFNTEIIDKIHTKNII